MLGSLRLYSALQGRYLRPYWPLVLLLGVLLFGMTGLQLVAPQIVRHFIDRAIEQEALRSLYAAVGLFLAAGLSVRVLQAVTGYLGRDIAWRATNRLRADLTLHVLRLDMGFHNARTPGDLLERIDGDIERLTNFFSQFFIQLVGAILLLAGLIVVTWLEDWRFGLSVAVFTAFFLLSRMEAARLHRAALAGGESGPGRAVRVPRRAALGRPGHPQEPARSRSRWPGSTRCCDRGSSRG